MWLMALKGIAPGPSAIKHNPAHKVYPNRIRDVTVDRPNQVWCKYIQSVEARVSVTGGCDGLVQLACSQSAVIEQHGGRVLPGGAG